MEKRHVIIFSEGEEYLCCREDGCCYDVSYPMRSFTRGKEDFGVMGPGQSRHGKTYPCHKRKSRLVPGLYPNSWLALSLEIPKTKEAYTVLIISLKNFPAFGVPDKAFTDTNNDPGAMDFLIRYDLAEDTGYRRRSEWVKHPMIELDLPELCRVSPAYFEESGQQSII